MQFSQFLDKIRIQAEEVDFHDADDAEVIKCQPDLLLVPPLPEGPRKWGAVHLAGYWIAEAFGIRSCARLLRSLLSFLLSVVSIR